MFTKSKGPLRGGSCFGFLLSHIFALWKKYVLCLFVYYFKSSVVTYTQKIQENLPQSSQDQIRAWTVGPGNPKIPNQNDALTKIKSMEPRPTATLQYFYALYCYGLYFIYLKIIWCTTIYFYLPTCIIRHKDFRSSDRFFLRLRVPQFKQWR